MHNGRGAWNAIVLVLRQDVEHERVLGGNQNGKRCENFTAPGKTGYDLDWSRGIHRLRRANPELGRFRKGFWAKRMS